MASTALLIAVWAVVAALIQSRYLPGPVEVAQDLWERLVHGALAADFAVTLQRAALGFVIAMALGTAIGLVLGRIRLMDRLFGDWVVVGLNIPAIVVAILCFIWLGLTETALVLAVVLNKTPLIATMMREGVMSLDPAYEELADGFRVSRARRLWKVRVPQLLPFFLAAARTSLSLIWKMVVFFEILGSDGGVGFRFSLMFQFFDVKGILAYASAFILVVMAMEFLILRPLERRLLAWRADLA